MSAARDDLAALMPKQIWIMPARDQWAQGTGEWMAEFWGLPSETPYILATPETLSDHSAVKALVAEAVAAERERGIAAIEAHFPGLLYASNRTKAIAAIRNGEKP
jgi:hypothetical protein